MPMSKEVSAINLMQKCFFQLFSSLLYYSCDAIIIKNANFSFFCLGMGLNTFFFKILVANYFWSQKRTFCRYSEWKFRNDGFSLHPTVQMGNQPQDT